MRARIVLDRPEPRARSPSDQRCASRSSRTAAPMRADNAPSSSAGGVTAVASMVIDRQL
jgi:hypothetical protein